MKQKYSEGYEVTIEVVTDLQNQITARIDKEVPAIVGLNNASIVCCLVL